MMPQPMWHKRWKTKKLIVLAILVILILGCMFGRKLWLASATKGYQAVFLTNGQVYFGKLSASGNFFKLTDIYYLQATQPLQQAGTGETPATPTQPNIQLVKLGSELHGPQDAMYIEHDKVLFWENMKDDSKVVDPIKKYKTK